MKQLVLVFPSRQRATALLPLAGTQEGPDLRSWASRRGSRLSSFLSLLLSSNLAAIGLDQKMTDLSVQPRGTRLELLGNRSPRDWGSRVYLQERRSRRKNICCSFLLKQGDRERKNPRAKPLFSRSCLSSDTQFPLRVM